VTAPNSPSGSSPLRLGGLVLLGIAAVAAVVGLVSLAGGGDSPSTTPSAAAPPSSAKAAMPPPVPPAAAPPAAAPPAKPAPVKPVVPVVPPPVKPAAPAPAPHTTPAPLPGAGLPPVGEPAGPKGSPGGAGVSGGSGSKSGDSGRVAAKVPVRVYNNSMIKDLAERVAADFRADGWQVTEVGNYPAGVIPNSTVYYRPGTSEQAAAESLATTFGMRAEPRFAGLQDASPGLIAIVTKDYQRR
jgi:hypothetical protein